MGKLSNVITRIKKSYFFSGRLVYLGLFLLLGVVFIAITAPYITAYDPLRTDVKQRLQAPSSDHYFGTDEYGRDLFSRVIYGARVSMIVGISVVFFSSLAGTIIGLISGYFRRLDNVIMRIMDACMAFPSILLAIAIIAALGSGMENVIIALSITYTPRTARIVRGKVLSVREEVYVEAAHSIGLDHLRIIFKYILPNILSPLIVQVSLIFALSILAEAGLSYIGAGTPPPTPSWGNILADGRPHMIKAPWMTIIPGVFIMISVIGLNIIGDGLRDYFDPRMKNSR